MGYVFPNRPSVYDPTDLAILNSMIANEAWVHSKINSLNVVGIVNGSFENNTLADGIRPDGWTYAALSGGHGEIIDASYHGGHAYKMTATGASGSGGATLTSTTSILISPSTEYSISFATFSTEVAMDNKVEILWYDLSGDPCSPVASNEIWADSATNPAAWEVQTGTVTSPADAVYAKIKITGGALGSVAGEANFDDIKFVEMAYYGIQEVYITPGTHTWICPANVNRLFIEDAVGPGAGGGGGGVLNRGGGGGGGAYLKTCVAVTPNKSYTITIPAGGIGGTAGNNGAAGLTSTKLTLGATVIAEALGGAFGLTNGNDGVGGVGTMTATDYASSGDDGDSGSGGKANAAPIPSIGGVYSVGAVGPAGTGYGAGGAGGSNGKAGGDGAPGIMVLRY